MHKHFSRPYNQAMHSTNALISSSYSSMPKPLRRLDPLFSQLSQLGLVTPHLKAVYWMNRRQALEDLLQEITLIQRLYEGTPLDIAPGNESLQSRAMELNTHLINTAQFGEYSNAEKVNILYQLRRAIERLSRQHFAEYHVNKARTSQ